MPKAMPPSIARGAAPSTNEAERWGALQRYTILDTPPEAAFDRITALAARVFDVPTVLIALVDGARVWCKSRYGFYPQEMVWDAATDSAALLHDEVLVMPDIRQGDRVINHPLLREHPKLRFYAGAPLKTPDGFHLGVLCLLDTQPRIPLTEAQQATLADLGAMVMDELELKLAAHKIAQVDTALLEVAQGISTVTGKAFFNALVQHLCKALDMSYACISLLVQENPPTVKTIAFCNRGTLTDNVEYTLEGTPCLEVIGHRKIRCYAQNVQALFPEDGFLVSLGIESYASIPFFDSQGKLLGLLGVMDQRPIENLPLVESLLTLFAMRIAAELERHQAEEMQQEAARRLQLYADVVQNAQVGIVVWKLEDWQNPGSFRLMLANPAASRATGFDFTSVIGTTMAESFPALVHSPLVSQYLEVAQGGRSLDLGEVSYGEDGITAGVYSLKAFPLPDNCLGLAFENMTASKQMESQLRESQHYNQQIAEAVPGILFVHDLVHQRNVYTNRQIADLLGYTSEQVWAMGENAIATLVHPDDVERVLAYFEAFRLAPDQAVLGIEYRVRHSNGEWRWFYTQSVVFNRTPEGTPCQVLGVCLDVSDRKQSEAALQASEERYRHLAEANPQIVWTTDDQGVITYFNPYWYDYTGLGEAESLGFQGSNVVHPEDRDRILQEWLAAVETGENYSVETRLRRWDGVYRWFLCRGLPVYHAEGHIVSWVGTTTDIDDQKRIQEQLRQNEERLRLALDAGHMGAWEWNLETNVQRWDVNQYRLFGVEKDKTELTAETFFQFIHPDDSSRTQQLTEQVLEQGGSFHTEFRIRHVDGSIRWLSSQGTVLQDANQKPVRMIGVNFDITERKQAEAEREHLLASERRARETAETANRIKDEFLAVLSHELRSPLNPILGWSKLLQNGDLNPQMTARALETIERNARLQTQLIDDLLDVSRILRGKMALNICSVNLVTVLESALETVRLAAAAKQIQIQTAIDLPENKVSGDATRLQQIVWNLLSNAVKFTPINGRIEVRLEAVGTYAYIQVKDTGKGINPDFLPYVFDYFRQEDGTTTRKFGGLGLGLAIVRHLTELHGGTVQVESAGEGQGATFTIRLPLLTATRTTDEVPPQSAQVVDLRQLQILVVDDDEDMRTLTQVLLEQEGAQVITVASAAEGLRHFDQQRPDLLISDIGMPDMDGYRLMQQIRRRSPEQGGLVPAIALTAYAGEADQRQALKAGFHKHLSKPIDPSRLVNAVAELIQQASVLSREC